LDIVNKFVATEAESRSQLEQQQGHIRTGLGKLLETQNQVTYCSSFAFVLLFILSVQVNQLRQEMVAKEQVLRAKDTEANNKLGTAIHGELGLQNKLNTIDHILCWAVQRNILQSISAGTELHSGSFNFLQQDGTKALLHFLLPCIVLEVDAVLDL
jgi:hypothetical protein